MNTGSMHTGCLFCGISVSPGIGKYDRSEANCVIIELEYKEENT